MNEAPDMLDWQQEFIATNLLAIGYNAWAGYLGGERGAIICSTNSSSVGFTGEAFKTYFVQRSRLAAFLHAWLAAPDTVILRHHFMNAHILEAVDTLQSGSSSRVLAGVVQSGHILLLEQPTHHATSMLQAGLQRMGGISTSVYESKHEQGMTKLTQSEHKFERRFERNNEQKQQISEIGVAA